MGWIIWAILWVVFMPLLGELLLNKYKKPWLGIFLCLFLGPLGILIALIIRMNAASEESRTFHIETLHSRESIGPNEHARKERECPYCAEMILAKAIVCKHCNRDVETIEEVIEAINDPAVSGRFI